MRKEPNKIAAIIAAEKALTDALDHWRLYFDHHRPTGVNGTEGFLEADSRLRLLPLCLDRIAQSHAFLLERWQRQGVQNALDTANVMSGPLRLDTEGFYWQCGRLRRLLRDLPGLQKFDPAGVRDVRNHLIEHPEGKASRILISSFAWSPESGPLIKTSRPIGSSQAFMDLGAFQNLVEFSEELSRRISVALPP